MLSDNLKALHARLAEYQTTGAEISAQGMTGICAVLAQASADALELERSSVVPHRTLPQGSLLVIEGGKP